MLYAYFVYSKHLSELHLSLALLCGIRSAHLFHSEMGSFGDVLYVSFMKSSLTKVNLYFHWGLSVRRLSRDLTFLNKRIHNAIDSELVCTLNINISARLNGSALIFYVRNQYMLSPITRIQTCANNFENASSGAFRVYANYRCVFNSSGFWILIV